MRSSESESVPDWLVTLGGLSWRLVAFAAAMYVLGVAFLKVEYIVVPVVAALFFTSILYPFASWLRRRGLPPLLATWVVFIAAILVVGGIVAGLVPSISGEFGQLGKELSQGVKHVERWLEGAPFHLSHNQVTSFVNNAKKQFSSNGSRLAHYGLTGAAAVAEGVAAALLTFVLTFFFVKDGDDIAAWFLTLADERRKRDVEAVGSMAWRTLSGYVRGTAANGVVNASLMVIGLLVLRVPLVAPIGLLTFAGGFLPIVGAILSGGVAALVALVARGPVAAVIVVGITLLIHNVEGYLVGPLVLGRAVRLHPVAILLSLAVGTTVGGVIGAFLAVPVVATLLSVNEYYRQKRKRALLTGTGTGSELSSPGATPRMGGAAG